MIRRRKRPPKVRKATAIHVSDHALVRYIERVMGIDVESFRRQILQGELGEAVKCFRSGKFQVDGVNGPVKAVVEGGVIITFR